MTHSAKEASFYIHKMREEGCILIASSSDHNASIMTAIVDILDGDREVIIDHSGSRELDRLIGKSQSIDFSTSIDDINIFFSSGAAEDTVHRGRPAFKIKMPRTVHRVQRRESYRASPPLSERPGCVMEYQGSAYQATIVNISIGGIRALIQNADFKAGDVIERCRITTPVGIEIEAALEIVYVGKTSDGGKDTQYGCRFKDANALVESNLQRYVTHLQAQELAKRREFGSF